MVTTTKTEGKKKRILRRFKENFSQKIIYHIYNINMQVHFSFQQACFSHVASQGTLVFR